MTQQRLFPTTHLTARDRRVVRAALACGRLDHGSLTTGKGRWTVHLSWCIPGRVLWYHDAGGHRQKVYIDGQPTEAERASDDAVDAENCKNIVKYLMGQAK